MDYNFETVWNGQTPDLINEIITFWTKENALPTDEIPLNRCKETVIVTRGSDGRIVGTSTAYARVVPRLGQPMYYYRMYSDAEHRGQRTGYAMLEKTKAVLEEFTRAQATPAALGIILEVENMAFSSRYPQAAWPMSFNFIGYSPRSLPLYVYYFPDAKLLPPAKQQTA